MNKSQAGHVLGSELTYNFTSSSSIQLDLKVYRDCSECKFNGNGGGHNSDNCSEISPIEVYGVNQNDEKVLLTTLSLNYVNIVNITNTCSGMTNGCGGANTPDFKGGVEVHNLQTSLSIQSYEQQGYCHLYFVSSIFSRSNSITPIGNPIPKFFNYSEVNFCSGIKSNSVTLGTSPNFFINANTAIYHSPGVISGDADSVSFSLVPALSGFDSEIPYSKNRSSNMPFSVSCPGNNCSPNPFSNPPAGFYFDPQTGNTVFTPSFSGEYATLVYEVKKWKRNNNDQMVMVGSIRRDFQIQTLTASNKEPVFENFTSNHTLCSGTSFSLPIPSIDNQNQTITYRGVNLISGMNLTQNSIAQAPFNTGLFTWTPPNNSVGNLYLITIEIRDNNCPLNAISSMTFKFKIEQNPQLSIILKQGTCGKIELQGMPAAFQDNLYYWRITYPNNVTTDLLGRNQSFEHVSGGKLDIELSLNQTCRGTTKDSLNLSKYTPPSFSLKPEYISCKGTNITVSPINLIGNEPFEYFWNNIKGSTSYVHNVKQDYSLELNIIDKNGCQNSASSVLKSFPVIKPITKDSSFCEFEDGRFVLSSVIISNHYGKKIGFEALGGGTQIFDDNGQLYFLKENFTPKYISFIAWVEDENACKYYDTFTIFKTSSLNFPETVPGPFCKSSDQINLYEFYGYKPSDGRFFSEFPGAINEQGILNPSAYSYVGLHEILFISATKHCSRLFSRYIEIVKLPDLSWIKNIDTLVCKNSSPISINGDNINGIWNGKGIKDNYFYPNFPNILAGEKYVLTYSETESKTLCVVKDSIMISVWDAPSFEITFANESHKEKDTFCISEKQIQIELISTFNTSNFPYSFTNTLISNKGELNNNILDFKNEGGAYTLSLTTNNSICPSNTSKKLIFVEQLPQITFNTNGPVFCKNEAELIVNYSTTNTSQIFWRLNETEIAETTNPTGVFTYDFINSGTYILDIKLANSACNVLENILNPIIVHTSPYPVISANPSKYVPYDLRTLDVYDKGIYNTPILSRLWVVEGVEYNNIINIAHKLKSEEGEIIISLLVVDSNYCETLVESNLFISPPLDIYIPNAFSPNASGPESNNVFKVNAEHSIEFEMIVLNIWGAVVYKSNNYNEGWDGTYMGDDCVKGTYAYYIKVVNHLGGMREFKGTVVLIR